MIEVPIEMEVSTSYQPRTSSDSDLPIVTVDDNGKILRVVNGEWDKSEEVKELPQVTTQDDGKVLKVLNGNWTLSESSGGVSDYSELTNKPSINSTELVGDKSLSSLGIQETLVSGTNIKTINGKNVLGEGNIQISGGSGLSDDIKTSLLACFQHVAWIDSHGQDYYNALYEALYDTPSRTLESISAVFTQGSAVIYDTVPLDSLKQYLVVTANYSDSTTETVTNYTLSGTLTVGTSVITVTYGEKTATFTVNVTATPTITGIEATYTQGQTVVYTDTSLNSLKSNLVVKAIFSDNTKSQLDDSAYTLSGTLTVGTSTITVTYETFTTTFTVVVSERAVLNSINAVFTQTSMVYTDTPLDDLKESLVVTAIYSDSTTQTISETDYTLSGTLTEETSTITVTYEGKTDTFTVTVTTSQEGVLYQLETPKITDGSTRTDTGVKLADVDKDWSICYDYELTNVPSVTTSSYSFGNINIGVSDAKVGTSSLVYNPLKNETTKLNVYMNGIVGNHAIGVITHSVGSKCVKYNIEYTIGGTKYPFTGTTPVQSHDLIVSQVTMQFGATNGTSHKFNRFIINDYVLTNEEITNFMTGDNE